MKLNDWMRFKMLMKMDTEGSGGGAGGNEPPAGGEGGNGGSEGGSVHRGLWLAGNIPGNRCAHCRNFPAEPHSES